MPSSIESSPRPPSLHPVRWPADLAVWAAHGVRRRRFAWLDGDGGRSRRGRYSFMTWDPHRAVRAWGDRVLEERWTEAGYRQRLYHEHPWRLLERLRLW